jgi:hypothetical protein
MRIDFRIIQGRADALAATPTKHPPCLGSRRSDRPHHNPLRAVAGHDRGAQLTAGLERFDHHAPRVNNGEELVRDHIQRRFDVDLTSERRRHVGERFQLL